jgi:hypothetical protein
MGAVFFGTEIACVVEGVVERAVGKHGHERPIEIVGETLRPRYDCRVGVGTVVADDDWSVILCHWRGGNDYQRATQVVCKEVRSAPQCPARESYRFVNTQDDDVAVEAFVIVNHASIGTCSGRAS